MKLTSIEKEWYDKLSEIGMSNYDANLMARLKILFEEYKRKYPDDIVDFKGFVNPNGSFHQFCIDSGRLTSDEINEFFHKMLQQCQNNPFDIPFNIRYNPVKTLWKYFKNIFK